MTEEKDGFAIKDNRSFNSEGEVKDTTDQGEPEKEDIPKEAPKKEKERPPLPEVDFTSLILTLSSTALFNLGEIADPRTNEKTKDLSIAKHSIDIIVMLKDKTKGNLSENEQKFIENVLTDMRWRYVKAAK